MEKVNKYICQTCYRELEEKGMKHNNAGLPSDQCVTCYQMIGKGVGYGSGIYSDKEIDDWLTDYDKRKADLILKGKLK
jgi:hypothetical protein